MANEKAVYTGTCPFCAAWRYFQRRKYYCWLVCTGCGRRWKTPKNSTTTAGT